jgi:tryptophanyl-tRNA synthetase
MTQKRDIIVTGDRPTGKLHLGHYVGSLAQRVVLQEDHTQFILIADVQALTDNFDNPQKIRDNITEVLLDYLAVGIDPEKSTIFLQSSIPEIAELTIYYLNLVSLNRLKRNPTVKAELQQKEFGDGVTAGFLMYPVSQAADISIFKATVIPVGEDQLPMIEQMNELVRAFNRIYKRDVFVEAKPLLSRMSRLPGIDGKSKMSKSLGNAIYLADTADEIARKVMLMYTDPNHIKVTDPGQVEGNTVFTYLDVFDPNRAEVEELKVQYMRGGLGDVKVKRRLIEVLNTLLEPIRLRRAFFAQNTDEALKVLAAGTEKAQAAAEKTMKEVREAMGLMRF